MLVDEKRKQVGGWDANNLAVKYCTPRCGGVRAQHPARLVAVESESAASLSKQRVVLHIGMKPRMRRELVVAQSLSQYERRS